MREYERQRLLERIGRDGATVGATIPETIEIAGETLALSEFVFEVKRLDSVPPETREEVAEAKTLLRRERLRRKRRLETAELTYGEGEELAAEIVGIDRALNALESLGPTDLEAEVEATKTADTKRWFSFLREVLGHDETGKRRGVR